jgi:hypothetical protein
MGAGGDDLIAKLLLVGCPCAATAHNNAYINYPPKSSQGFLLIVSALHIIFFMNARVS